jgi:hypothetical protein
VLSDRSISQFRNPVHRISFLQVFVLAQFPEETLRQTLINNALIGFCNPKMGREVQGKEAEKDGKQNR